MPRPVTRRQLRGGLSGVHPATSEALQAVALPAHDPAARHWPVEVLVRCVALRAHDLAGTRPLARLDADDAGALRLWGEALADVSALDDDALTAWLAAPRPVQVPCGRATHRLVLAAGQVLPEQHPGLDLDAEQVAAALGGTPVGCVTALLAAADPQGPTDGGLGLLRWLRAVHAWAQAGHRPGASHPAVQAGLAPDRLRPHLDAGLSLAEAVAWAGLPLEDVLRWRALRATPEEALVWQRQGRGPQDAERATDLLRGPRDRRRRTRLLTTWLAVAGSRPSLEDVVAWAASGRAPHMWGELAARRIRVDEAERWVAAGLGPVEVLRFHALRVPLPEARRWREAMPAVEAASFLAAGVPLAEAVQLRDLPPDVVRRLWPQAGSAAEVRRLHTEEQAQGLLLPERRTA